MLEANIWRARSDTLHKFPWLRGGVIVSVIHGSVTAQAVCIYLE